MGVGKILPLHSVYVVLLWSHIPAQASEWLLSAMSNSGQPTTKVTQLQDGKVTIEMDHKPGLSAGLGGNSVVEHTGSPKFDLQETWTPKIYYLQNNFYYFPKVFVLLSTSTGYQRHILS